LTNEDIVDLYARAQMGARVVVLRGQPLPSAPTALPASVVDTAIVPSNVETRLVPPAEVPGHPRSYR